VGILKKAHDEVGFAALARKPRHLTPRAGFFRKLAMLEKLPRWVTAPDVTDPTGRAERVLHG
jgi:hypothetical protein